jgi:hypothetical protein
MTTPAIEPPASEHLLKAADALVRCIAIAGGTDTSYALVANWLYRTAERDPTPLLDRLVDALISERDDPRNRAEHNGFYAGMTRAITVVRMALEKQYGQCDGP